MKVPGLVFALLPLLSFPVTYALEVDTPGELSANTTLSPALAKPVIFNAPEQRVASRSIKGLLSIVPRQACPSGEGVCPNSGGRCAPLKATCCPDGRTYCDPGFLCYADICCKANQRGCENNSCCNPGQECCKGGGCCDPGYYCALLSGDVVCYPTGGSSGGGGGSGGSGSAPSPTTTKAFTPTTTIRETTEAFTSVTFTTSSTATYTVVTTYTSVPPAPTGYQNKQIDWSDTEFEWSAGWTVVTASCNSTAKAKRCSSDYNYVSYSFQGTAIYLSFGLSNVNYAIYLNAEKVIEYNGILDGTDTKPHNCTYSWASEQLSGDETHTLEIQVYGSATPLRSGRALGDDDWWLELNNLVVQKPGSGSSSGSSATGAIGGDGSAGSGGSTVVSSNGYTFLVTFLLANLGILLT